MAEAWDTTNREQVYKDIAKSGFGQSARALEELGLQGGALERGQQSMAQQLAFALQGAGERGEQQQRQSLMQQAGLHEAAAGMLPGVQNLMMAPLNLEASYQSLLNQALGMATGIPGYQYQPPMVPQTGQFLGPAIAGAAGDLGQAFAYNQGMQQGYRPQYGQQQPWGQYSNFAGGPSTMYPGPNRYTQQQQFA
jgi:hypothetical protein